MAITIEMPRLSDSMHEGIVLRWVKRIGDFVEVGDHLADIETDKAHVELQACEDGTLTEILVPEGKSVAVGQPIALLQSEFGTSDTACPTPPCAAKCSPLAAKLALGQGLDLSTIQGTGPHGKIMAADIRAAARPSNTPARKVQVPPVSKDAHAVTRVDDFYLYSLEANMAYLAAISTPIAVQCEKLIGGRYSLFDYVVRAAVKACLSEPDWLAGDQAVNLLMVLDKGEKYISIENASGKTIYDIAMKRLPAVKGSEPEPGSVAPNLLLCDSGVNVEAQRAVLKEMPHSIVNIGGTTPKTGIEAGRPVSKLILPVTLYVNANILPAGKAAKIAAEFKTLLENPVLLLL